MGSNNAVYFKEAEPSSGEMEIGQKWQIIDSLEQKGGTL